PFVGGDGIAGDASFIDQAGARAAANSVATVAAPDPSSFTSGAAATFVRAYHVRYPGQDVDGYGANAYDAAMVFIIAIKNLIRAGREVTRTAVLDQVQNITYAGVTGTIRFDKSGDITHGVFSVYGVQDGHWVWVKQISV
ncbi:MAG TPA: ABC transporter substrate-binding protein, partial [Ktedonobacterales bacterium]|nr:ABC transporter substrate-binding protein [Ktedonobacterales bacterium]